MVLAYFSCCYRASRYRALARARQKNAFWRGVLARARARARGTSTQQQQQQQQQEQEQEQQQQQQQGF